MYIHITQFLDTSLLDSGFILAFLVKQIGNVHVASKTMTEIESGNCTMTTGTQSLQTVQDSTGRP